MGAKLSWEKKNIAKIILFKEYGVTGSNFKHGGHPARAVWKGAGLAQGPYSPTKRIKNNQYNIKWYHLRLLLAYYQTTKLTPNIETRLDILLFRTNWFLNKEAVIKVIKSGNIKVNNQTIIYSHFHLKPGYLITVNHLSINNSLIKEWGNGTTRYSTNVNVNMISTSDPVCEARGAKTALSSVEGYELWLKKRKNNMIPSASHLEINNNIKGIIILKRPLFKNIPVPFNLHRLYYEKI